MTTLEIQNNYRSTRGDLGINSGQRVYLPSAVRIKSSTVSDRRLSLESLLNSAPAVNFCGFRLKKVHQGPFCFICSYRRNAALDADGTRYGRLLPRLLL